jgi:hypothetical protein
MTISREEAKALGLKRFFGRLCERGHDGQRYVRGGGCFGCADDRLKARRQSAAQEKRPTNLVERVEKKLKSGRPTTTIENR